MTRPIADKAARDALLADPEIREAVRRAAAEAPPPTPEQIALLRSFGFGRVRSKKPDTPQG